MDTPIHRRLPRSRRSCHTALLATPDVDVNKENKAGSAPLYAAAQQGHTAVVTTLLAVPGVDVNKGTNRGWTPLFVAAHQPRPDCSCCSLAGCYRNRSGTPRRTHRVRRGQGKRKRSSSESATTGIDREVLELCVHLNEDAAWHWADSELATCEAAKDYDTVLQTLTLEFYPPVVAGPPLVAGWDIVQTLLQPLDIATDVLGDA